MKRDWDLVRQILLALEEKPDVDYGLHAMSGVDNEQLVYHASLLLDGGLIDGRVQRTHLDRPTSVSMLRLTWAGHELLAHMQDPQVWEEVKTVASKSRVTLAVESIKDIFVDISAKAIAEYLKP